MSKIIHLEIQKLDREISATGTRIEQLKLHIQNQEKERALAKNIEKGLDHNISLLKTGAVIASASEYKKVKADYAAMVKRVDDLGIDIKNAYVYLDRAKKLLIDLNDKRDILNVEPMGKLLTGKFGSKQ